MTREQRSVIVLLNKPTFDEFKRALVELANAGAPPEARISLSDDGESQTVSVNWFA